MIKFPSNTDMKPSPAASTHIFHIQKFIKGSIDFFHKIVQIQLIVFQRLWWKRQYNENQNPKGIGWGKL